MIIFYTHILRGLLFSKRLHISQIDSRAIKYHIIIIMYIEEDISE